MVLDIPFSDPSVDDFGAYAEWLIQEGLAPPTIKNHLSAIKNLYLLWDFPKVVQIFDSHGWALTLRALKFANRLTYDDKSSLTLPHLLALVRICDINCSLWPLRVALIFGYMGFLRVSNLAPNTAQEFDRTRHTTWSDIWASESGVLVFLKWTKTMQAAGSSACIPLPELGDSDLCPLRAWREYRSLLTDCAVTPDSPFLLSTVPPVGKVITVPIIRAMLRRAAEAAGLSEERYTPHSLRRGGGRRVVLIQA